MKRSLVTLFRFLVPPAYRRRRSLSVRYAFPALALLGVMFGALAVSSQDSLIELVADDSTVAAGQPVTISVYVTAQVPVNAVDMQISVPAGVQVTGIDTGESVITLWTEDPYEADGIVYFRGGTFRRGFVGRHLIGTIRAVPETSGLATFRVDTGVLLAGDGSGSTVPAVNDGEVQLYIANADGSFDRTPVGVDGAVATIVITDIDGDGEVSLADVSRFMAAWSARTLVYDFNNDGRMTFRDFGIILSDVFFK